MAKKWRIALVLLFIIVSGSAFPIYNFGKHYTHALTGILLYLNIACYLELGIFEKRVLKLQKVSYAIFMNLGIIFVGMGYRYLLEWGEVSNTYNFTMSNVLLHVTVTFAISTLSYLLVKNKP